MSWAAGRSLAVLISQGGCRRADRGSSSQRAIDEEVGRGCFVVVPGESVGPGPSDGVWVDVVQQLLEECGIDDVKRFDESGEVLDHIRLAQREAFDNGGARALYEGESGVAVDSR